MEFKIIENFFNESLYNELKSFFLSEMCIWTLNSKIIAHDSSDYFDKEININLIEEKLIEDEIYYTNNNFNLNHFYNYQFVCPLYNINTKTKIHTNNDMKNIFYKIINSKELQDLNISKILRIKANIANYCGKDLYHHNFHTDININKYKNDNKENFKTLVIYFNTCNGYTLIKKYNEKIYSKDNRCLLFNTYLEHLGTNTTNDKFRLVLNINYIQK